jgi:ABC-type nitrate/sulfonate/bicarbonate transport system substrate-binding protein
LNAPISAEGYPNVIFATEDTAQNRPDLVEAFLRAGLRGYQDAVEANEQAAGYALEYNPDLNFDSELASMALSVRLIVPPNNQIGAMSEQTWRINYELLRDGGLLPDDFDVAAAYTLDFLSRIYPADGE